MNEAVESEGECGRVEGQMPGLSPDDLEADTTIRDYSKFNRSSTISWDIHPVVTRPLYIKVRHNETSRKQSDPHYFCCQKVTWM